MATNKPATRAKGPGASAAGSPPRRRVKPTERNAARQRANLAIGGRRRQKRRSSGVCAARGRLADGLGDGKAILEPGAKTLT
jgi:hypothetical protein